MEHSVFDSAQTLQRNHRQHSLGVEALFQDLGKDTRDLELDFAADLGPIGPPGTRMDSWPTLPALPINYLPGLGGHPPGLPDLTRSQQDDGIGKWRGFDMQPDIPQLTQTRMYNGSANPMGGNIFNPQFSSNHSTNPSCISEPLLSVDESEDLKPARALPQLPSGHRSDPPRLSKTSSRQADKMEREREKAEKLKEKNKRAQRKFRQRQKDRQESAEKLVQDLAEQLKQVQMEKESLAFRNQELEQSLQHATRAQERVEEPTSLPQDEPTFKPAEGWTVYDPKKGMVLVATTSAKLTHDMIMRLSLKDFVKLMTESVRRIQDTLESYDKNPADSWVCKRLTALVNERHALLSYLAINKPQALYQIICTKMVDPPEENCQAPSLELWEKFLEDIVLSPEQMKNILTARRIYIRKMDELLRERSLLRSQFNDLKDNVEPQDVPMLPGMHLEWMQILDKFRENIDVFHRCNAYFMARIWYGDCLDVVQVARVITRAFPYNINIFAVVRVLTKRQGHPNHLDTMLAERVKYEDGPNSLDQYVSAFPGAASDAQRSRKLDSDASSVSALPELYNTFSNSLALESSGGSSQL